MANPIANSRAIIRSCGGAINLRVYKRKEVRKAYRKRDSDLHVGRESSSTYLERIFVATAAELYGDGEGFG